MRKKICVLSFAIVVFFCLSMNAQTWSGKIRLTWNGNSNKYPAVTVDSIDHVYIVFSNNTDLYMKIGT